MRARIIYNIQAQPTDIMAIHRRISQAGFKVKSLDVTGAMLRATATSVHPCYRWQEAAEHLPMISIASAVKHQDFFLRQGISADSTTALDDARMLFMMDERRPHVVLSAGFSHAIYDFPTETTA